jgi:hypothetical protein
MKINNNLKPPTCQPSIWPSALLGVVFAVVLACSVQPLRAQSYVPVGVTVDTSTPGGYIPYDLLGISEEMGGIQVDNWNPTGYFFAGTNTQLVTLFTNVGFQSFRVGGNSGDDYIPNDQEIDTFFGFINAITTNQGLPVGLFPVTFALCLKHPPGSASVDGPEAEYIDKNYNPSQYVTFAIGNEPNVYYTDAEFQSGYLPAWNSIETAVINDCPGFVYLGGPDNSQGNIGWTSLFANAEINNANVYTLDYHYEPCGDANSLDDWNLGVQMLRNSVDNAYYPNTNAVLVKDCNVGNYPNVALTEFNAFVNNNQPTTATGDGFANALFALDALYWWAQTSANENIDYQIHFHSGLGGFHGAFYYDPSGTLQAYPLLYGCAAYSAGGGRDALHNYGSVYTVPITSLTGTNNVNLTAYAIGDYNSSGTCTNLYVTAINKSFGSSAETSTVSIFPTGMPNGSKVYEMFLVQASGDVTATNNVTLGGAPITGTNAWQGQWAYYGMVESGVWRQYVTNLTACIINIRNP